MRKRTVPKLGELNGNREQNYQTIERWLDECEDHRVSMIPFISKTSPDLRRVWRYFSKLRKKDWDDRLPFES